MRPRLLLASVVVVALSGAGCTEPVRDRSETRAGDEGPGGLPTATTTRDVDSYVALGDSFTAAPGVPVTDSRSGCMRSNHNYPALVAQALAASHVDVSCAGAATPALLGEQHTGGGVKPPQLDALAEDTDLVTVGIGGNDEGLFVDLVVTCVQASNPDAVGTPCRDAFATRQGADRLMRKIRVIRENVTAALLDIQDRSPDAEVVLVGYPQLVPPAGTCPELPLAPGDYPYLGSIVARLGKALARAAELGGATYIDMVEASRGHDVCAGDEAWVNGINTDVERAMAFHPFAEEQVAVADLVIEAL